MNDSWQDESISKCKLKVTTFRHLHDNLVFIILLGWFNRQNGKMVSNSDDDLPSTIEIQLAMIYHDAVKDKELAVTLPIPISTGE